VLHPRAVTHNPALEVGVELVMDREQKKLEEKDIMVEPKVGGARMEL